MPPKICNFYITFRCNDTCEFCKVWNEPELQKITEADHEQIIRKLENLKSRGISILNLDGGEPLMVEHLPQILQKAKELGFFINLYTNGILFPERASELKGLANAIYLAIDYPTAELHDRSRGVECFSEMINTIKLGKAQGENIILMFTITRDSILLMPEVVELAEAYGVRLLLNPVYDFFGTQGFEKNSVDYIRYYFKRKCVDVDLAILALVQDRGIKTYWPRCYAKQTVFTVLPDGREVGPCLFIQGGRQGREDVCSGCLHWPYLLPSFERGWDKYRVLHEYSRWYNTKKSKEGVK